jgi:hypothetical protein
MLPLLAFAAMQAKEVAESGGKAGLSIVESSILGALLILSVCLNIWLVSTVIKVQNARIADKDKDSKRIEDLNGKLITVFGEMKNSLDNLTAAETTGQGILQSVKQSLDTVILAAVQGTLRPGASPTPRPGGE